MYATHVINFALRQILGGHVDQEGSSVMPEKLRLDFAHPAGLTNDELQKVEDFCVGVINDKKRIFTFEMELKKAEQIPGIRYTAGEAY